MKTCSVEDCDRTHSAKGYCTLHYKRYLRYGEPGAAETKRHDKQIRYCTVNDCNVQAKARGLCVNHYQRFTNHGTTDLLKLPNPNGYVRDNGYVVRYNKNHPVANKDGKVYVHREVLYNAIGEGPHLCHWDCGTELRWRDNLTVDHLDSNKTNNSLENLVPSCPNCNYTREGSYKRGRPKKKE